MIDQGIRTLIQTHPDAKELNYAIQALQFLKLNRTGRIETLRHLAILLDPRAFSIDDININSTLILKFVKMTERVKTEAIRMKQL